MIGGYLGGICISLGVSRGYMGMFGGTWGVFGDVWGGWG